MVLFGQEAKEGFDTKGICSKFQAQWYTMRGRNSVEWVQALHTLTDSEIQNPVRKVVTS